MKNSDKVTKPFEKTIISPACAPNYTVYNASSNPISSVSVSSPPPGLNTTYYNPTFPITFNTGGVVTITVHFTGSGPTGGLRSYKNGALLDCEDYDPHYLIPMIFPAGGCGDKFVLSISLLSCP